MCILFFVGVSWLAFLVSCELNTEILNLVFFYCQLWKFQQKYRCINPIIKDVLEVDSIIGSFLVIARNNGKCAATESL